MPLLNSHSIRLYEFSYNFRKFQDHLLTTKQARHVPQLSSQASLTALVCHHFCIHCTLLYMYINIQSWSTYTCICYIISLSTASEWVKIISSLLSNLFMWIFQQLWEHKCLVEQVERFNVCLQIVTRRYISHIDYLCGDIAVHRNIYTNHILIMLPKVGDSTMRRT